MMVASILAILAALAIPSFTATIARYQTGTVADEVANLIATARTEAIRRGGDVVLQKKAAGANPCPNNQQWSCGLTLWADTDRDATQDANEPVLKELDVPAGVNLLNMSGTSPARLTFNRWGQANGINALHFIAMRAGISAADRSVCVTSGGRIRVVEGIVCP